MEQNLILTHYFSCKEGKELIACTGNISRKNSFWFGEESLL